MNILDKITGPWQRQWAILWFVCGAIALSAGFWYSTDHSQLEIIKLVVALIGLVCVVALAFRRNIAGNGLGITANIGEIFVQGRSGATGLMLAPIFYLTTHLYGLYYWHKNEDGDGNMIPRKANATVWIITAIFIAAGLAIFPWLNDQLQQYSFIESGNDTAISFAGINLSWYTINVIAFVLGVTAQTTMILRYSFSWGIWLLVNCVWLAVNIANHNTIFAIQTIVYQVNAFIGLYEWWKSSRKTTVKH